MPTEPLVDGFQNRQVRLGGRPGGPLFGLTFAAKDIYDVAGYVTGNGNPDWERTHEPAKGTAWAVRALVDAGASLEGKTITDELTRGIFGENVHYSTPVNPRAPGRVPGGSSSGSASAVAAGLVDFALGSDTGGSVRIPASFCGLYGLRTTLGRIPMDGVLPQAPSFDTIGWFARDAQTFARVGAVLLGGRPVGASPSRLVIAEDAFEAADEDVRQALQPAMDRLTAQFGTVTRTRLAPGGLNAWTAAQGVLQNREAWVTAGEWIERVNPRFSFEVSERYVTARDVTDEQVARARVVADAAAGRMEEVLGRDAVVCLPTAPFPASPLGESVTRKSRELRPRIFALTCIAGLLGAPQITLPAAEVQGLPVGLSLLGARGADQMLIGLAQDWEGDGSK